MALFSQLKQIKDLRKQAKEYKSSMGEEMVVGSGAGAAVKVTMDGTQKLIGAEVDPTLLNADNKEKFEKAIVEAVNDAQKELQKIMLKKLQSGELKMPEMGK